MNMYDMTIEQAITERKRILGFRSLSTADWSRVTKLGLHIDDLQDQQRKAAPIELAEKVGRFPRIVRTGAR